ncbi:MAG TPA: shikimate dehydrogenase [Burkholderiales bacterium]|nr:shikimate dehydrogenase [Burkholderiales bacterium]
MTDRYAVIGNPVAHSQSPFIHAEFARQTGQDLVYERILAPLDRFSATVQDFRAEGGHGLNVTLPFKLEAFRLANELGVRAQEAEAVNTLKFEGATVYGDNTDGTGLVRDIQDNLGFRIEGRDVLVMGAGGAAQGVASVLLEAKPGRLVIANRTVEKAERLAGRLRTARSISPATLSASSYPELAGRQFDLIINATAASLNDTAPDVPEGTFGPDSLAYDMMYGKGMTPFLELALSQGAARLADGIGMLVEQAAESFLIWRGVRPQTRPVIEALKAR